MEERRGLRTRTLGEVARDIAHEQSRGEITDGMRLAARLVQHKDCWRGEPCEIGKDAECPKVKEHDRRERMRLAGQWSRLELGADGYASLADARRANPGGSDRHFLDGQSIHCGDRLLLQAREERTERFADEDDWTYDAYVDRGRIVRYELVAPRDGASLDDRVVLYVVVDGISFTTKLCPSMRFRWPEGR